MLVLSGFQQIPGRNHRADRNSPRLARVLGQGWRADRVPCPVERSDPDLLHIPAEIAEDDRSGDRLDERRRTTPVSKSIPLLVPLLTGIGNARADREHHTRSAIDLAA